MQKMSGKGNRNGNGTDPYSYCYCNMIVAPQDPAGFEWQGKRIHRDCLSTKRRDDYPKILKAFEEWQREKHRRENDLAIKFLRGKVAEKQARPSV